MIASRRWQDWASTAIGVLVAASPFAFATSYSSLEAWAAYIVGALIFLVGVATLAFPKTSFGQVVQIVLAVVLFATPWAIGFTAVTGMAWAVWILAVALVAVVGYEFFTSPGTGRLSTAA